MDSKRPPQPILSIYATHPELEERIETFVVQMGERIDLLQDLESEGNFERLRAGAEAFAVESHELGYEPLAQTARLVAAACVEQNPEAARKGLCDLTELCQRVRRGHRSSA